MFKKILNKIFHRGRDSEFEKLYREIEKNVRNQLI